MNSGKTAFAQLMSFLPWYEFDKCVVRYNGNYKVQHFNCRQQFMVMIFGQMTIKESLHDCIVHKIRNSTRHVIEKDRKAVCKDLKMIYTASDREGIDSIRSIWTTLGCKIQGNKALMDRRLG